MNLSVVLPPVPPTVKAVPPDALEAELIDTGQLPAKYVPVSAPASCHSVQPLDVRV